MLPEMERVLDAIVSHRAGRLNCVKAGEFLGLTERHIRRSREAYENRGEEGLVDRRRGRVSSSRVPDAEAEWLAEAFRTRFSVLESNTSTSRSWDRRCCAGLFTRRLPRVCRVGTTSPP